MASSDMRREAVCGEALAGISERYWPVWDAVEWAEEWVRPEWCDCDDTLGRGLDEAGVRYWADGLVPG